MSTKNKIFKEIHDSIRSEYYDFKVSYDMKSMDDLAFMEFSKTILHTNSDNLKDLNKELIIRRNSNNNTIIILNRKIKILKKKLNEAISTYKILTTQVVNHYVKNASSNEDIIKNTTNMLLSKNSKFFTPNESLRLSINVLQDSLVESLSLIKNLHLSNKVIKNAICRISSN